MVSKAQKEVQCDHCGTSQGAKSVFSGQKVFLGRKITDVLETITHRSIPSSLPIKICFVCTSTFMSSAALIEKVRETVDRIQAQPAKNSKAAEKEEQPAQEREKKAVKVPKKNTTIRQRSKSIAAIPASFINTEIEINNASPKKLDKTPKKHLSRLLEDNLNDSVKLTPAKEVSSTKKVFLNLFGNGDNDAIEVLTESEEEEASDKGPITINTNNFQCAECAFHTKYPKPYKEHLQKEHGLQRPRIYSCTLCIKTFGVLKTLKTHLRDAHSRTFETEAGAKAKAKENKEKEPEGKKKPEKKAKEPKVVSQSKKPKEGKTKGKKTEETKSRNGTKAAEDEAEVNNENGADADSDNADITQAPKIASFKALNESLMKKRMLENVMDSDYTFAINGSSASTPRADSINFQCDICDVELTTAKQMQDHMKTAHGVEKPKIFKCHVCEKGLATKQSLKTHMTLHNEGAEVSNTSKRKILQEEDEDVDILGTTQRENTAQNNEGPKQSLHTPGTKVAKSGSRKILQEEDEVVEILDAFESNNTADDDDGPTEEKIIRPKNEVDGGMIAPRSPAKKAKKGNTSQADLSVSSINGNTPSKTQKRKKQDKSEDTLPASDVDVVEEINYNVKPHKKARLESIGDSTADESTLSCDQCGKFAKSRQRLDSHIEKKHASQLKCTLCREIYKNQIDYVAHFSDCGSESGLPCGVANCKKVFTEANYLCSHLRKRHQLH
ncbi:zinc finger protein CG2199 [Drosophila santomea]|uniref:zinc finger protein CG2199 n=1 Tax=Drosophila santomea TaxID=129105 RepID=UPI0019540D5B|nr:zinc finger protein CG2199 [Drosophila santomea]